MEVKMSDGFFENSIDVYNEEQLLLATPYSGKTKINFDKNLSEDYFFDHLYCERLSDEENEAANARFDKEMSDILDWISTPTSHIDLIHLKGYGGCGKTTYIHHLLRSERFTNAPIFCVDFEGAIIVREKLINVLANVISKDLGGTIQYFKDMFSGAVFDYSHFKGYLSDNDFEKLITLLEEVDSNSRKTILIEKLERTIIRFCVTVDKSFNNEGVNQSQDSFSNATIVIKLLLTLLLFLLFKEKFDSYSDYTYEKDLLVLLYDNVDSIDNYREEGLLANSIDSFTQECEYFFDKNIVRDNEYRGIVIQNLIKNTKFIFFLTTRMVTINRYITFTDLEDNSAWRDLEMPEHYYSHYEIINHRIDFYNSVEKNPNSKRLRSLNEIKTFANTAYKTNIFKRTFNGNNRYCIGTLCSLRRDVDYKSLISQSIQLRELAPKFGKNSLVFATGSNGIILATLFDYFKEKGIYTEKLKLSICQKDNTISLSRIILTILNESTLPISMWDLFDWIAPAYSDYFNTPDKKEEDKLDNILDDIILTVWALSEPKRDIWRRLLTFNIVYPSTINDLFKQKRYYKDRNTDPALYSRLDLCRAGKAYVDYVVPHFEFMMSRYKDINAGAHRLQYPTYQPLFMDSSIKKDNGKYKFETKIERVYKSVSECCDNSKYFAELIMKSKNLSQEQYMEQTPFNYRFTYNEYHQSYESKLIFSHVGYIEKYRQYLLLTINDADLCADYSERIIYWIKKYLELYETEGKCFRSEEHNRILSILKAKIEVIKLSDYKDFSTKIERED